jgi:hypothetical protein
VIAALLLAALALAGTAGVLLYSLDSWLTLPLLLDSWQINPWRQPSYEVRAVTTPKRGTATPRFSRYCYSFRRCLPSIADRILLDFE